MATPSRFEQYMLELINRARLHPEAEASRQGINLNQGLAPGTLDGSAKQPLAMNGTIIDAARGHSQWMLDNDSFTHTGAGGSDAGQRMEDAGYATLPFKWGENIAWQGTTGTIDLVDFWGDLHDNLFKSSGHRENILDGGFREIGVGGRVGTFTSGGTDFNAVMVTQNFAKSGSSFFVTGTAFNDADGDRFYDVGEGEGGIAVSVAGGGSATTWASGGYAVAVSPGTYDVTFSGGPFGTPKTQQVSVGSANVKLDPIGTDMLASSASLDLGGDFRHLDLLGTADIDGSGNGLGNTIRGNAGANVLAGESGDDTLSGGADDDRLQGGPGADAMDGGTGNDVYRVDDGGDTVTEASGGGTDTVLATTTFNLPAHVENMDLRGGADLNGGGNGLDNRLVGNKADNELTGGAGADDLRGGRGNDIFAGGPGADAMAGGSGNDVYRVDRGSDSVIESSGDGIDGIIATTNAILPAHVENLGLDGAADLKGGGNAHDNVLIGNKGDNELDGGGGADDLRGGRGDDILAGGQGDDTLSGHAGADDLRGGGGDDRLVGGSGPDTMSGGSGNDVFWVDDAGDSVTESLGGGTDAVFATASFSLPVHVEELDLHGSADLDGDGNGLDNVLVGNKGDNELNGGAGGDDLRGGRGNDVLAGGPGSDAMMGGSGNDVYQVDRGGDRAVEAPGGGIDGIIATSNAILPANIENLDLAGAEDLKGGGNGLDNVLVGNKGNNELNGGAGADDLRGGRGNDVLAGDQGDDTLAGARGADDLRGGDGDDWLFGGSGSDTMTGGSGNDVYYVDRGGDRAVEAPSGGIDGIIATSNAVLPANVENLDLQGAVDLKGGGNGLANTLTGNKADNELNGGAGADDLRGGRGDDSLTGGQGNDALSGASGDDTFVFGANFGDDTVADFTPGAGTPDVLRFPGLSGVSDLSITQPGADAVVTVDATGDTVTLKGVSMSAIDTGADLLFT